MPAGLTLLLSRQASDVLAGIAKRFEPSVVQTTGSSNDRSQPYSAMRVPVVRDGIAAIEAAAFFRSPGLVIAAFGHAGNRMRLHARTPPFRAALSRQRNSATDQMRRSLIQS